MKLPPRVAFLIVLLAVGGLCWWLTQPAPVVPAPAQTAVAAPVPAPVKLAPPKSAVMAPVLPPVVQPAAPAPQMAATQPAPAQKTDVQTDLATAIPDLANLLASGDLVTAFENYTPPAAMAQLPSQQIAAIEDQLRAVAQQPQAVARLAVFSEVLGSFNGQTPTYNAAGDVAAYPITDPATGTSQGSFHFQKVDGRWYIAQTDLGRLGNALGM